MNELSTSIEKEKGASLLLEPVASAAELCLRLIMLQSDTDTRMRYVRDFCSLYEIREKSKPAIVNESIGRLIEPRENKR